MNAVVGGMRNLSGVLSSGDEDMCFVYGFVEDGEEDIDFVCVFVEDAEEDANSIVRLWKTLIGRKKIKENMFY